MTHDVGTDTELSARVTALECEIEELHDRLRAVTTSVVAAAAALSLLAGAQLVSS